MCIRDSYHPAKFGGDRISPAAGVAKNVEFFVCMSVCLSVTLLNVRVCAPDFAMKALEYRNDFDAGGWGKVCSCLPMLNFLRLMPIATSLNAKVQKRQKTAKIGVFRRHSRINRSRRNFAGKRVPWVCYSSPNMALIGKRESVQEPPKTSKFAQNCGFWPPEADTTNTFR